MERRHVKLKGGGSGKACSRRMSVSGQEGCDRGKEAVRSTAASIVKVQKKVSVRCLVVARPFAVHPSLAGSKQHEQCD